MISECLQCIVYVYQICCWTRTFTVAVELKVRNGHNNGSQLFTNLHCFRTYQAFVEIHSSFSLIVVSFRDAIAKALYSSLFSWLVQRVNSIVFKGPRKTSIAILDIFGFEVSHQRDKSTSFYGSLERFRFLTWCHCKLSNLSSVSFSVPFPPISERSSYSALQPI